LYTTSKAMVFMIKYENGTKDVFAGPSMGGHDMHGGHREMHGGYKEGEMKGDYESLMHKYRRSLAGGIVMTAIGVPLIPPGLALSIAGFAMSGSSHDQFGNKNEFNDGGPLIATGAILLAAGITMTVIGPLKIKMAKRYKAKARELGPSMSFSPAVTPAVSGQAMRTGAGIRLNF
jgi:hypothetical protein